MNIRKANIEDIDILIRLRLDYLIADLGGISADEEMLIRSQLLEYFSKNINNSFIAILAETDNIVASTAFLVITERPANPAFITGKIGIMHNVFTYPDYRRKGIASKVISRIIDEAKQMNLSYIELSATSDGKPLYEKFGFTEPKSKYTPMKLKLV